MYLRELLPQAEEGALFSNRAFMCLAMWSNGTLYWRDEKGVKTMLVKITLDVLNDRWEIAEPAPGACNKCDGTGRVDKGWCKTLINNPNLVCPDCKGTGLNP